MTAGELITRYPLLSSAKADIERAEELMFDTYIGGGKMLLCGNGGSASDCEHIVGELMKGFLSPRKLTEKESEKFSGYCKDYKAFAGKIQLGIPAISLPSQSAVLTAYCNDVDPSMVYAQLTYGYGREGDLLIAISTSGNSENVVNAVITAKAIGMSTIALTGQNESALSELCDCTVHAPETQTYRIQEYHLPIYHYLCAKLEEKIGKYREENDI